LHEAPSALSIRELAIASLRPLRGLDVKRQLWRAILGSFEEMRQLTFGYPRR
jgi:hypothetical protein